MEFHSIPAFVALIFKLFLLVYALRSRVKNSVTRLFLFFLVAFGLFNLSEVLLLNYFPRHGIDWVLYVFGYSYFATLIPAIAILLHLSLRFATTMPVSPRAYALLYLPAGVLEFLLLFTDSLVTGFTPFQFSVIRIAGPLYFLFETYLTVYLAAALVNLVYAARGSFKPSIARIRNRLWLAGLAPMALLMIYLILSRHMDWPKLSSTFNVPIAQTFFLLVATYATHQYRLFDIEFFIPWSKVRKRKTAFYQRIQATIAEIAEMRSVKEVTEFLADVFRCQVALVGGLRPLVALAKEQQSSVAAQLLLSQFPREALQKVQHIVVANEIADSRPDLYSLMKQYRVGAIVPFNAHSATSGHWMLLGEHFSDEVYTPLDFRFVEALFDKIAERFLDNLNLLRSQLTDAQGEMQDLKRRLAMAWDDLATQRRKVALAEKENRALREEKVQLLRSTLKVVGDELPGQIVSGQKTLDRYLMEYEAKLVDAALRESRGDKAKAARLLGLWPNNIDYLLQRHNLDPTKYV